MITKNKLGPVALLLAGLLMATGCLSVRDTDNTVRLDRMPEGIRSPDSLTPAGLLIRNQSTRDLDVYWIDFDGERQPQTTIGAGKSGVIGARIGHAFEIEHAGTFVRLAFANFPTEELTLTDADFAKPDKYRELEIEGWPVRLDRTLAPSQAADAEAFLQEKLLEVKQLVPAKHIPALQTVAIWLDKDVADRGQYHPGFYWMETGGWQIDKYKAVHFGSFERLLNYPKSQPMVVLHELCHAFHDQVLGFDDTRVEKAYLHAKEKKLYDAVRHLNGKTVRAYAMQDEREYFAELTEAYFGVNDFYPFTRDELRSHDPTGYKMIEAVWGVKKPKTPYHIAGPSEAQLAEYKLDREFFKKSLTVQDIVIATSAKVSDFTLYEAAYQFDAMMRNLDPAVAQRIRDKKVLCILAGNNELTSDIPQFKTDKTGDELDFYNWRQRGFLTRKAGRQIVFFAEEDVLEYTGGMQKESILIHEFGHVIHGAGFDKQMQERLTATYNNAIETGLWNDGYAAQRFGRVTTETSVSLLDALAKSFPEQSRGSLSNCLDRGHILVNQEPSHSAVKVTKADKVRIVFGGPKQCYAAKNRSEYWAEVLQCWYDTNRTMDHDHNHIHTREQLTLYDPVAAKMCLDILGDSPWRFLSPRERAGTGHLKGYDPAKSPKSVLLPHIREAALDYYDEYWKEYWARLSQ